MLWGEEKSCLCQELNNNSLRLSKYNINSTRLLEVCVKRVGYMICAQSPLLNFLIIIEVSYVFITFSD